MADNNSTTTELIVKNMSTFLLDTLRQDNPWDRQAHETDPQFAAFQIFRDLQPSQRTLRRVAEELERQGYHSGRGETEITTAGLCSTVQGWSKRNGWRTRVYEYDRFNDQVMQLENLEIRQRSRARRLQEGVKLQIAALQILERAEVATLTRDEARGLLNQVRSLIHEGVAIERDALGEASVVKLAIDNTGEGKAPGLMSDSELNQAIRAKLAEVQIMADEDDETDGTVIIDKEPG